MMNPVQGSARAYDSYDSSSVETPGARTTEPEDDTQVRPPSPLAAYYPIRTTEVRIFAKLRTQLQHNFTFAGVEKIT